MEAIDSEENNSWNRVGGLLMEAGSIPMSDPVVSVSAALE